MNPNFLVQYWFLIAPFVLLDLALKGFALWKSANQQQKVWFVCLLLINSMGILPGVYLLFFQKKQS
jgi:hypothetical protein